VKKIYSLEVKKGFVWIDLEVLDFPGGDNIKIKALGMEKQEPINSNNLLLLINSNWNQKEFEYTTNKGSIIRFTQIS
jgi:hypothetical protein